MLRSLFPRNQHPVERVLRTVVGIGLLSLVFFGPRTSWGVLGIIPLITGLSGSCALYTVFGISTCPREGT